MATKHDFPVLISCSTIVPANATIGFHAKPACGRWTVSIIWNCLVVMFFAVWSTIHLSTRTLHYPLWYKPILHSVSRYFWSPWRRLYRKKTNGYMGDEESPNFTSRKVFEAAVTVLFPETGLVVAVEEFILAWYIRRATRRVEGWGSFSLKQAHLVAMGGILLPNLQAAQDFDQLVLHSSMNFDDFPTHTQISHRAKKDYMDKIIAMFQGVYFMANCWERYHHTSNLARLEFITLNYLIYVLLVSLLRYSKPQELHDPFDSKWSIAEIDFDYPGSSVGVRGEVDPRSPFYAWYLHRRLYIFGMILVTLAIAGALNFAYRLGYTHRTQSLLWRITLAGIVCILFLPLRQISRERNLSRGESPGWLDKLTGVFVWISCLAYIGVRLRLLVSPFYIFRWAEANDYATAPSWTQYLGHVGN